MLANYASESGGLVPPGKSSVWVPRRDARTEGAGAGGRGGGRREGESTHDSDSSSATTTSSSSTRTSTSAGNIASTNDGGGGDGSTVAVAVAAADGCEEALVVARRRYGLWDGETVALLPRGERAPAFG